MKRDELGRFVKGHIGYNKGTHTTSTEINCTHCGTPIIRCPSLIRKHNFCSKTCLSEWDSEFLKGSNNPFYGRHHTENCINHIREVKTKFYQTGRGQEIKLISSMTQKNKHHSPQTEFRGGHISKIKGKTWEEYIGYEKALLLKKRLSEIGKGRHNSPSTEFKKGQMKSSIIQKSLKSQFIRPTKPEAILINIIKALRLPYLYVGDGEVMFGNKNPDFIQCNGKKKIIEVFSEYWHNPERYNKCSYHQTEKGTKEYYSKYGYDTLVLWSNEFGDYDQIINKLIDFER